MPALPENDEATRDAVSPTSSTRRTAGSEDGRAVVSLTPSVAAAARRMGKQMGDISTTEVVRRGLILLDLLLSLPDQEEMVIRNKVTQQVDRLRFGWDTF